MRIACSICHEDYEYTSEISALYCGHTFHQHCLNRWLDTCSSTCPQCRVNVTRTKIVHKIFLDKANEDEVHDPGELKNIADNLKLRLREKDQEKNDILETIKKREETIENLEDRVKRIERMYKEVQITNKSQRKQLDYFKSQQEEALKAKEEARMIKNHLTNMKNVELMVKGVESEVDDIIDKTADGPAAVKHLSGYCKVLKKELENLKEKKKKLQDNVDKQKKQLGAQRREIDFKAERIKALELILKKVRVPATPDTPATPLPCSTATSHPRPKLTAPTDNGSFIEFDGENLDDVSPNRNIGITNSAKRKADCKEYGVGYMKIQSAADDAPAKKVRVEPLQDVPTPIIPMNILKNMYRKADSGKVRTDYNGLGAHDKFVRWSPPKSRTMGIGKSLMKPKGRQASLANFFGK